MTVLDQSAVLEFELGSDLNDEQFLRLHLGLHLNGFLHFPLVIKYCKHGLRIKYGLYISGQGLFYLLNRVVLDLAYSFTLMLNNAYILCSCGRVVTDNIADAKFRRSC